MLEVERQRLDGAITHGERHNKIIDIWHRATENVSDEMFSEMKRVEEERGETSTSRPSAARCCVPSASATPTSW